MTVINGDDPHAPRRISATIKFPESKRYAGDNPWMVFEGSVASVRSQIIEAFAMSEESVEGLPLFDIVANAQDMATKVGELKAGLGGATILSKGPGPGGTTPPPSNGTAWETAGSLAAPPAKTEEQAEVERLTAEVAKVTTVADLQELWARNQEAFKDAGLMAAYKQKGKSLST